VPKPFGPALADDVRLPIRHRPALGAEQAAQRREDRTKVLADEAGGDRRAQRLGDGPADHNTGDVPQDGVSHGSRLPVRLGGRDPEWAVRAALPAARPIRMASNNSAAVQPEAPILRAVAIAAGMSRSRPAIVTLAQVVPAAHATASSTLAGAWAAWGHARQQSRSSSRTAAITANASSNSPGASCPSECANGHVGDDQWELV